VTTSDGYPAGEAMGNHAANLQCVAHTPGTRPK
jgi:hypothetical protein